MLFEFEQQFDGTQPEVSAIEQEQASHAFSKLVDKMLATNIELDTVGSSRWLKS